MMQPNKGSCPSEARGKRIRGTLRNSMAFGYEALGNALPSGWAADTTRWTLTDAPWDIREWELAK